MQIPCWASQTYCSGTNHFQAHLIPSWSNDVRHPAHSPSISEWQSDEAEVLPDGRRWDWSDTASDSECADDWTLGRMIEDVEWTWVLGQSSSQPVVAVALNIFFLLIHCISDNSMEAIVAPTPMLLQSKEGSHKVPPMHPPWVCPWRLLSKQHRRRSQPRFFGLSIDYPLTHPRFMSWNPSSMPFSHPQASLFFFWGVQTHRAYSQGSNKVQWKHETSSSENTNCGKWMLISLYHPRSFVFKMFDTYLIFGVYYSYIFNIFVFYISIYVYIIPGAQTTLFFEGRSLQNKANIPSFSGGCGLVFQRPLRSNRLIGKYYPRRW